MFRNEEEIRSKLILPYIKDLGFELSEISLEDSYTIRLGRTEKPMKGRSDFLCRRNEQNLFLIEIKKDSHRINSDDIDQAISYSRALVGNIAPFTIITNGKTTRIFDTITKTELNGSKISEQSDFWRNDCKMSTDKDLRIRYESLMRFVSFEPDNLKIFCEEQIHDTIKLISGDIHSSRAKFIESLHFQRLKLRSSFNEFVKSSSSVFGIVGKAGVGKTCSVCSLVSESITNNFSLFYNGTLLNEPIVDTISKDLNLFFSTKSERDKVFNKLDDLGRLSNTNVIIFIDAIDEIISNNFPNELSDISLTIGKLNNIKLCVSCKSTVWNRFLVRNETNFHTFHELVKFHSIEKEIKNPGFVLDEFNEVESKDIIPKYRSSFEFKGEISGSVLQKLHNGFFLRIFSEVYRNREVPMVVNDIELIERYLSQSFKRTPLGLQTCFRILGQIGKVILKHNSSKHRFYDDEEGVDVNLIFDELDMPIGSNIPQELFDRNILIKTGDDISYKISFYYSTIRDYVICYHSYRLDKNDDELFYENLSNFFENYIGLSAIAFYLQNAKQSQLDVYSKFKEDKALSYVTVYNSFLDEHFPKIKKEFNPKTDGKIGIIIPYDLVHKDGYALIPLDSEEDDLIHYDSFDYDISTSRQDINVFKKGAKSYTSSNSDLMVRNQKALVKKNVLEQLKEIVENGQLYEFDSDILSLEKVASILYYHHKRLGFQLKTKDYYMPRFDQIYPLDLKKVWEVLYKYKVGYYYKNQNINQNDIPLFIEEAFRTKKEIPKFNTIGSFPPYEELFNCISILLERGYNKIDRHYLPSPDIPLKDVIEHYNVKRSNKIDEIRDFQFSVEQKKEYIKVFFEKLEIAYKEIVETNFPTLKSRMTFYNNIPHEYYFYLRDSSNVNFGRYGYKKSSNGQFKLTFKIPQNKENLFKNGDGIRILRGYSFDRFINILSPVKITQGLNSNNADNNCVIRNWMYEILMDDLSECLEEYDVQIFRHMH